MSFLGIFLAILQGAPPALARGDRFQIVVPQGWKIARALSDVVLQHATGASLIVRRAAQVRNIDTFAKDGVERIMAPLGFAKLGAAERFQDTNIESVQYEIRGNRLSEHRRIQYRVTRRDSAVFEAIYENSEDAFDVLITEAQSITASLQVIIERPPQRRRGGR